MRGARYYITIGLLVTSDRRERCFWWLRKLSAFARPAGETRWIRALAPLEWVSLALPGAMPAVSVPTRWGLRLLQTRAAGAGGVFLLTHARADVGIEAESPALRGGLRLHREAPLRPNESAWSFARAGTSSPSAAGSTLVVELLFE